MSDLSKNLINIKTEKKQIKLRKLRKVDKIRISSAGFELFIFISDLMVGNA